MRNEENAIIISDATSAVFAAIEGWFLIFQSGLI